MSSSVSEPDGPRVWVSGPRTSQANHIASLLQEALPTWHIVSKASWPSADDLPDMAILVLDAHEDPAFQACRRLCSEHAGPLMVVDAHPAPRHEVQALEDGADDYVASDVEPAVLVARVKALLRRRGPVRLSVDDAQHSRLTFGSLVIDASTREASMDNRLLDLTSAEFDLLWLLAYHAGQIVTREAIFAELRGIKYDGQDRSIDVRVSRIRAKIGDDPHQPTRIKTVRSRGYLFVKDLGGKDR